MKKIRTKKREKAKDNRKSERIIAFHEVKISSEYFMSVVNQLKKSELRYNDRGYKVGDKLYMREFDGKEYSGHYVLCRITHVLKNYIGLDDDFVILSIEVIDWG